MPGGRGGARKGAGAKRREPEGVNPFEIAKQRVEAKKVRLAEQEELQEEERRKRLLAGPGWSCSLCTFDNLSDDAKLNGVCGVCAAPRGETDSDVTMADANAMNGNASQPELTEGGMLSLAQMFVRIVRRQSFTGLVKYLTKGVDDQILRFQNEFKAAEDAVKKSMEEAQRLAAQVEESRKKIEGRDSLKDLTDCEDWIATTPGGVAWCEFCSKYCAGVTADPRQLKSPWIRGSVGFRGTPINLFDLTRGEVRKKVEKHLESDLHQSCVEAKADEGSQPTIREAVDAVKQIEREAMRNLLRVALHCAKNKKAILQYEELVYLCDLNGAVVGDREHSRKTAQTMLEVAAQIGKRQILNFLTKVNPIMNHKPHFFIKADKACDRQMKQFEIINIRLNYFGTPLILHLKIVPIGSGDYTENVPGTDGTSPEAGSLVCFNLILETVEEYGVDMIKNQISIFEVNDHPGIGLGIAEQGRGSVFDGEYCYNGALGGNGGDNVKALFKDPVRGYGDTTHETGHDPSHALDIAKELGAKAVPDNYVLDTIHVMVKAVYAHYSKSPKRTRSLLRLCDEWGIKYEELHYLFEVRFIASETMVLKAFLTDLPVIVLHLRLEAVDADVDGNVKSKIRGWLKKITTFRFVSTLITQLDIDETIKEFSVKAQSSEPLWIHYPDMVAILHSNVQALQRDIGSNSKRLFSQLEKGELWATVDEKMKQPPEDADAPGEGKSTFDFIDGKWILKMKLGQSPGATETKKTMLEHQKACVSTLLSNIRSRLPVPEVLRKLRDVFDFDRMELSNPSPEAFEQLQTHGDEAIDWLVENKFPKLDAETIKADALKVRIWVKDNYDRFYEKDEAKSTWQAKRRSNHVPKPHFKIAGNGSIMEALFLTPNVVGRYIAQYLQIADYMIAYDITTADVERIGSHMQLIKSPLRCSQLDSTFAVLTFLSFNLPFLHEVDLDIIIEAWRKTGHKLPINKNEAESIVLSRLQNRVSSTFFMKKNDFLPDASDDFKWIKEKA